MSETRERQRPARWEKEVFGFSLREEEVCTFLKGRDLSLCGHPPRRPELRGDTWKTQKDSGHRTLRGCGTETVGISLGPMLHGSKSLPMLCCHFRWGIQGHRAQSQDCCPAQPCLAAGANSNWNPSRAQLDRLYATGRCTSAGSRGRLFPICTKVPYGLAEGLLVP